MLAVIILLPVVGAIVAGLTHRRSATAGVTALAVCLAGSAGAAIAAMPSALATPLAASLAWAAPLGPELALRADALGCILASLVGGVGAAVAIYAGGYLHGDRGLGRLLVAIGCFATAMQLLALADDIWLVFVAWELTSVCSYLLVLHTRSPEARGAATTALLVTGGGGLVLLAGLVLLETAAGTARLSELSAAREVILASPLLIPATVLVIVGCATKSALFPFHFWLPGAMAAPTPVSAYLHAATMVKAGIFLLARVHPAIGGTAVWEGLLGGMGAATVLVASLRLAPADDLKQLLAWSTVLALGTLAVLLSLDSPEAALAVIVVLVAHAGYKGALFLVVGSIDHGAGTRSSAQLAGLRRSLPWTAAIGALAAASMMGLPPFAGFVAKDQAKLAGLGAGWLPSAALMLSACAMVAVAWWTGVRPFLGRSTRPEAHESGPTILLPALALALLGLILGAAGVWIAEPLALRAAADLAGAALTPGLSPVPGGWGKAAVAAGVLAVGLAVAWQRQRVAAWCARLPQDLCARAWDAGVHGLIAIGRACVHVLQHGDLRGYIAVVLLATVAMAAPALAGLAALPAHGPLPMWVWPVAGLIIVGAVAAAAARTRLFAVCALGAVGYGIALLFLGLGAPDLALTQVLVETLAVVLLVLAFRHLPSLSGARPPGRRFATAVVAGLAGLTATGLVLAAQSEQIAPHLGQGLIAAAWERGQGANAVNVILVDIRALDTLGEITVLLIAALGIAALADKGGERPALLARSPILAGAGRIVLPLAGALAIFLWWRGHHEPGGGFAAGLCLGAGAVLVAVAEGAAVARRRLLLPPLAWAAIGLAVALSAGLAGTITGHGFLYPLWAGPLGTPLLFDLGVMLLVLGVVVEAGERLLAAEEASP